MFNTSSSTIPPFSFSRRWEPAAETTAFDDDEPLLPAPSPSPDSYPAAASSLTIESIPEFHAVPAADSHPDFAVLVKSRAPPPAPSRASRAPVDLVAVLDVSGSMNGYKISLLKRSMNFILDTLGPSDRLSIVHFSSTARRSLGLRRMTESGRAEARFAVSSLTAGGGTDIKAGLDTGVRVLESRRHHNPVCGVVLLSDGQDTFQFGNFHYDAFRGNKDYSRLLPQSLRAPIHTFGFGSDHDPRVMHAIAEASGGTFSFIEEEASIQDAFAMCIGGLLSVVAQQVELIVSSASTDVIRINSVDSGSHPSKILNHGLAAAIDIGDLYADEEKSFLVHITVPPKPAADGSMSMPLLTVKCSYKDPLSGKAIHVDGETTVIQRPETVPEEDNTVNLAVDGQRNRVLVVESMKEAQTKADKGDLEGARAVLTNRRVALLESAAAKAGDGLCGWLEAELREIEKRMENLHMYEYSGRAYALSGLAAHGRQRAAGGAMAANVSNFNDLMMGASATGPAMMYGGGSTAPQFGNQAPQYGNASQFGGGQAFGAPFGGGQAFGFGSTGQAFGSLAPLFGGYQTQAMNDMVKKSKEYNLESQKKP